MKKLLWLMMLLMVCSTSHAVRDLETGTFLTRDPAGFKDGPNQYCYVHCNPITKFDPLGLDARSCQLHNDNFGFFDFIRGVQGAYHNTVDVVQNWFEGAQYNSPAQSYGGFLTDAPDKAQLKAARDIVEPAHQAAEKVTGIPHSDPTIQGYKMAGDGNAFILSLGMGPLMASKQNSLSHAATDVIDDLPWGSKTDLVDLYSLRAAEDGFYPVMKWGSKENVGGVFLEAGDIWKFGTTKNPKTRYTQKFLNSTGRGLEYVKEKWGQLKDMLKNEADAITEVVEETGELPPGNKMVK